MNLRGIGNLIEVRIKEGMDAAMIVIAGRSVVQHSLLPLPLEVSPSSSWVIQSQARIEDFIRQSSLMISSSFQWIISEPKQKIIREMVISHVELKSWKSS